MSRKRDPGLDPYRSHYLSECVHMIAVCSPSDLHLIVDSVDDNIARFNEEHRGRDERQDELARDLARWVKKHYVYPGADGGDDDDFS